MIYKYEVFGLNGPLATERNMPRKRERNGQTENEKKRKRKKKKFDLQVGEIEKNSQTEGKYNENDGKRKNE